jgi:hypothetical protein
MPRGYSAADGSSVRAAVLRKRRHSERDRNDCGPKHHGVILRPIEFLFQSGGITAC